MPKKRLVSQQALWKTICAVCVGALTTLFAGASATRLEQARDWALYPAIAVVGTDEDIYALGDIHGDYERMVGLLAIAGIIRDVPDSPTQIKWNAGKSLLVCTGDLIDKWHHGLNVIAALRALQADAAQAGGCVIVTIGNHEAEFLANPVNRKDKEFLGELRDANLDPEQVAAGTDRLGVGRFLRSLPFAAKVNDWFFAHAGNTAGRSLEQLGAALQDSVDHNGFGALTSEDSLLEARLKDHPWWEKPSEPASQSEARLRAYVQALGAKHMVIGHQPEHVVFADGDRREAGKIFTKFDGLIFLIDVGMSRGVDKGKPSLLRIHGRNNLKATEIKHNGETQRVWSQQ